METKELNDFMQKNNIKNECKACEFYGTHSDNIKYTLLNPKRLYVECKVCGAKYLEKSIDDD